MASPVQAQTEEEVVTENPTVFVFGRDTCAVCKSNLLI